MALLRFIAAWLFAFGVTAIKWSCRYKVHGHDYRPALRAKKQPYLYAMLHAQQLAGLMTHGERRCGTIVSRSKDGDLLVPTCKLTRVAPRRGSTRQGTTDKGGAAALASLVRFVKRTGAPATITVDGPRGPRNHVAAGIAKLAAEAEAVVLVVMCVPRRRFILRRTWDRMQIPMPWSFIDCCMSKPLDPRDAPDLDTFRQQVHEALCELERRADPAEFAACERLREARPERKPRDERRAPHPAPAPVEAARAS